MLIFSLSMIIFAKTEKDEPTKFNVNKVRVYEDPNDLKNYSVRDGHGYFTLGASEIVINANNVQDILYLKKQEKKEETPKYLIKTFKAYSTSLGRDIYVIVYLDQIELSVSIVTGDFSVDFIHYHGQ